MVPSDVETPDAFETERSRLIGLAYRITGSRTDADDVVQDAWMRWQRADRTSIERPAAWLTTVTSRVAARSAEGRLPVPRDLCRPVAAGSRRHRPEPGATRAELAESLTIGFLAVLERLGPRRAGGVPARRRVRRPVREIADVVGRSPDVVPPGRRPVPAAASATSDHGSSPTDEQAWQVTAAFLTAAQRRRSDALVGAARRRRGARQRRRAGPSRRSTSRRRAARIPRFVANLAGRVPEARRPSRARSTVSRAS